MNDKQQLAAMGEHTREIEECEHALLQKRVLHLEELVERMTNRLAWRNTGSPNGLRRFMTQKQYDAQTLGVQKWYEPLQYEVPDGWQLVPVDPTKKMIDESIDAGRFDEDDAVFFWASMLAAAPEYKP